MELTAYRQFAELEETHFWFIGRRRIMFRLLDAALAGQRDLRLLEIGCGAGGMLSPLSRYGHVTGLDISPEILRNARLHGSTPLCVGSGYDLPIRDGSLDVIALFDTIEHIPDDVRVLRQCRGALKPGGLLFLSVPAYQFLYANNDRVAHHLRRYTRGQISHKLAEAGFMPTKITYFNTLLFPAILPIVLMKKLQERFFTVGDRTNLSHQVSPIANRLLATVMSSERHLLARIDFPFGHSLIGMARA